MLNKIRIKPSLWFRPRQVQAPRGFTLIELMATIAIAGIMMAIAAPNYQAWRERTALGSASKTLIAEIRHARILAVAENRSVSVWFDVANNKYTVDSGNADPLKRKTIQLTEVLPTLFFFEAPFGAGTTLTFKSTGIANQGHVTIQNGKGAIKIITVNLIGRTYYS